MSDQDQIPPPIETATDAFLLHTKAPLSAQARGIVSSRSTGDLADLTVFRRNGEDLLEPIVEKDDSRDEMNVERKRYLRSNVWCTHRCNS